MPLKMGLKTIALPLALLCMAVPVATAMLLVDRQAEQAENQLILQYARDALTRSEETGDQLAAVARAIGSLPEEDRCSARGLDVMRRLDLESTMLQGVGYAQGGTLLCSSFNGTTPLDIGAPDFVSARNIGNWTRVRLFGATPRFLAFSIDGAVAIVHQDLALSFVGTVPGLAVGSFNWSRRVPLITRGSYHPGWLQRDVKDEIVFRDRDRIVAIVRSHRFDIAAIAALPQTETANFEARAAAILLPIGLVTGVIFSILMVHVVRTRLSLPSLIQQGLRRNEFSLVFQPGVNMHNGRTIAAEALLRWRRPDGEIVPPDVFVAAAEDAGMIRLLTARVIKLLGETSAFRDLPRDFPFAVNLSADDLYAPATVDALRAFITRPGPGTHTLIVEATERSLVDPERARSVIEQLRSLGIRVAIDDFGTGYCSLGYLATLDVDFVKIDKLFVKALCTDSPTSSVAGHIIKIAKDLKLRTVAEGIETEAQAAVLRDLGVLAGQGWLYGPPMSAEELVARVLAEQADAPPDPVPAAAS